MKIIRKKINNNKIGIQHFEHCYCSETLENQPEINYCFSKRRLCIASLQNRLSDFLTLKFFLVII